MEERENMIAPAQRIKNAADDDVVDRDVKVSTAREELIKSEKQSLDEEKSNAVLGLASILLIIAINTANFVNGLYMAVPGPTLLFLADNVSADVSMVSTILSGRAAGNLLGAFAATLLPGHSSRFRNPTIKLGLVFIVHGSVILTIPFVKNLWLMVINLSAGGFFFGLTNTGFLAMQMDIWGERKSRPLMQLFQGIFSIGAMLAPLIANPFLNMASKYDESRSNVPTCQRDDNITNVTESFGIQALNESMPKDDFETSVNPVTWVYIIIGSAAVLSALFLISLALNGVESIARKDLNKTSEKKRQEEPFQKVALILFSVMWFYAFQVAAVNVFASYIYSVAYCSSLHFTISAASSLNSLYWGMIIVGRLLVFFVAEKIEPTKLISVCITTLLSSSILMSVFGEKYSFVAWSATALWALGVSPLFGGGVSWIYQITNVSGKYAVVFELGSAIGAVGSFPIAGVLFDMDVYSVIYFVSGLIGLLAICFVVMVWIRTRHQNLQKKHSPSKRIVRQSQR